jgi:hypothetical protein
MTYAVRHDEQEIHHRSVAHAYKQFLEMPVGVVLVLVWLAGAAFLGSCALMLYAVVSVLLGSIA